MATDHTGFMLELSDAQNADKSEVTTWINNLNTYQDEYIVEQLAYYICSALIKVCIGQPWFKEKFIMVFKKLYNANSNSVYILLLIDEAQHTINKLQQLKQLIENTKETEPSPKYNDVTNKNYALAWCNLNNVMYNLKNVLEQPNPFSGTTATACCFQTK